MAVEEEEGVAAKPRPGARTMDDTREEQLKRERSRSPRNKDAWPLNGVKASFSDGDSEDSQVFRRENVDDDREEKRLCECESEDDIEHIASVNLNDLEMQWVEPRVDDQVLVVQEPHAGRIADGL